MNYESKIELSKLVDQYLQEFTSIKNDDTYDRYEIASYRIVNSMHMEEFLPDNMQSYNDIEFLQQLLQFGMHIGYLAYYLKIGTAD